MSDGWIRVGRTVMMRLSQVTWRKSNERGKVHEKGKTVEEESQERTIEFYAP
jgi:hypothetical protein